MIEAGRASIIEREQSDHLNAGSSEGGGALKHFVALTSFIKIADKDERGILRRADESLTIADICGPKVIALRFCTNPKEIKLVFSIGSICTDVPGKK